MGERELSERVDAHRRPYETHWQMNPRTRAVLDEALDAAMAARGGRPPSVVLDGTVPAPAPGVSAEAARDVTPESEKDKA